MDRKRVWNHLSLSQDRNGANGDYPIIASYKSLEWMAFLANDVQRKQVVVDNTTTPEHLARVGARRTRLPNAFRAVQTGVIVPGKDDLQRGLLALSLSTMSADTSRLSS